MSVDAGVVIAVAGDEGLQVGRGFGQVVDVEGHVLDEAGGAGPARAAHRGEDARADGPVLAILRRVVREAHGDVSGEGGKCLRDAGNVLRQLFLCSAFGFGQDGGQARGVGHFGLVAQVVGVVHGREALVVQQFGALHQPFAGVVHQLLHGHHGAAGVFDVREVEHGAGLAGIVIFGLHCHLRQEGQGAFAAHHQMGDDVEGVLEAHEGQEVESRDVLDGVFIADAFGQFLVGADVVAQGAEALQEFAVGHLERGAADGVARVQHGAVGQDDAGREHHLVAVGVRAAVHARGVVHHDAAHHGALDRCGVGGELAAVGGQQLVDALADEAGLQGDLFVVGADGVLLPMLAGDDEDRVADGLSGQAGARRAEGDGHAVARGQAEQLGYFVLVLRADDDLRDEAVESGVRAPGQAAQFVGIDAFLRDERLDVVQEFDVRVLLYRCHKTT